MFPPSRDWLLHHSDPAVFQTLQHYPGLGPPLPRQLFQRPLALGHLQQSLEHRSVRDEGGGCIANLKNIPTSLKELTKCFY